MNSIAFIFTHGPHGTSGGREGLDAVLATSALSDNIALFFIGDGVLQLMPGQQPQKILARDYIATFGVLPLYDIEQCYLCAESLAERGLTADSARVLPVEILSGELLRARLNDFDCVITF
ncbi:hypothetical protein ED28_08985 [[Pantoea] beijingensis]|uniref:Protein TusC n=1 Tax=[Pantoea] beijingensis TaxID=1324864 RepID=A0A443IEL2_9GAMM|nr:MULTISPECIES: sulfurtransferase complex subunit TusC [Erwiniaceae]RWR02507.1 hypothetical protein ED28_08985 [[Pantoea] beijingensis]